MKSLTTLLITIFYFSTVTSFAQKEDERLKEIFLDAEYFLINEDYSEALANYLKLYKRGYSENGNINYRMGMCYLKISGEKEKAVFYLVKAVKFCNAKYQEGVIRETNAPFDAYFYLGTAYRISNKLDSAIICYEQYKSFYQGKDPERTQLADHEIAACKFASAEMQKAENIFTVKLGRPVSTGSRDIYPVVSGDLNNLVYVSKQKFYDAIFYCNRINGKWSTPINITPEIQSDGDQYPTFLSYDGTELYLRKEDNFEADLLVSKKINGVWTKSESVGKNINSKYWEGNLSVSKDGSTMYFSSNRKEGFGDIDIYRAVKLPNGVWGKPENLGTKINTGLNDDSPYITEDGKRLYFVSQGHQTMGGYDIFYCNVEENGELSDPMHLGYPINTTDDDLYFYPLKNGEMAYTSFSQKGNVGYEDIYEIYINPDQQLLASLNIKPKDEAPVTKTIALLADSDPITSDISLSTEKDAENIITLPVLFFDFNSTDLTGGSKKALDYIITVCKNYDGIKLEFIGHTDAKGPDAYNFSLSEKRAMSARNYLVKNGIKSSIIDIKGMGEKKFVALNNNPNGTDNPEGRKYNRRVEIQVTEHKPGTKIIVEELAIPDSLKIQQP